MSLLITPQSPLYDALVELAQHGRFVCFAGLPGTGKSLMLQQLAHLAHIHARNIFMLQWDTARPAFEASADGQHYPLHNGVTHGMIRVAVGLWARRAVLAWHQQHPDPAYLLISEAPLVGNRLIELARPAADAAEAFLRMSACRFIIPTPSQALRQHLEAERERRAQQPQHPRENEDAPPHVLRDLWRQLFGVAQALGLAPAADATPTYDPSIYQRVYQHILVHRHTQVLSVDEVLPTTNHSVYNFNISLTHLVPSAADIEFALRQAESIYADPAKLQHAVERWYEL